jgi:hypothetical protein
VDPQQVVVTAQAGGLDFGDIALLGPVVKLLMGTLGAFAMFAMLRIYDRLSNRNHIDDMDNVATDPKALALYKGLRFLAVAILIGQLLH